MTSSQRMERIENEVAQDAQYAQMLEKVKMLEDRFCQIVDPMSVSKRDAVWDFVMYCESMSQYVLQLACSRMIFPEEIGQMAEG
jgi:hypothetical protein